MSTNGYKVIGTRPIRHDGVDKVTGRALYGADIRLTGMLHGKILRSPHAHARIKTIDLSAAQKMPGIIDVFAASDIKIDMPEIPLRLAPFKGFEKFLQKPIAVDKVRYVGEPIAVIIAENRYLAEDALAEITLDFDISPAVTGR